MVDALGTMDAIALSREAEVTDTIRVLRLARAGDVDAFEALVRRYERRVLSLAYKMVGNLDDAQDVAQNAFVRLWKYLDRIRDEARFSTWLYRLVVNASYDLLARRRSLREQVSIDDPDGAAGEMVDEAAIAVDREVAGLELKEKVMGALGRLSVCERSVFVMRDLEDMDVEEIAKIQEISKITVRRHLSNARHKMRKFLTELESGPHGVRSASVGEENES